MIFLAVWKITYPEPGCKPGLCVYIKSSVPKPQPFDAGQYKLLNPDFPHDSTINQFFLEQQFEAYRSLGYLLATRLAARLGFDGKVDPSKSIDFENLLKTGRCFPKDGAARSGQTP